MISSKEARPTAKSSDCGQRCVCTLRRDRRCTRARTPIVTKSSFSSKYPLWNQTDESHEYGVAQALVSRSFHKYSSNGNNQPDLPISLVLAVKSQSMADTILDLTVSRDRASERRKWTRMRKTRCRCPMSSESRTVQCQLEHVNVNGLTVFYC